MAIINYTSKTGAGQVVSNVPLPKTKQNQNEKKLTTNQKYMIGASAIATIALASICIAGKKGKGPLKKMLAQTSDDVAKNNFKEVMNEAGTQSTKYNKKGIIEEVSYFKNDKRYETVKYAADGKTEAYRTTYNPDTQKPIKKIIHNEEV